jgi:hypothetical protein
MGRHAAGADDDGRIWRNQVKVNSIFASISPPSRPSPREDQVTKLEEDKISAYYGGGILYASQDRPAALTVTAELPWGWRFAAPSPFASWAGS